jgi:hypothetical protein
MPTRPEQWRRGDIVESHRAATRQVPRPIGKRPSNQGMEMVDLRCHASISTFEMGPLCGSRPVTRRVYLHKFGIPWAYRRPPSVQGRPGCSMSSADPHDSVNGARAGFGAAAYATAASSDEAAHIHLGLVWHDTKVQIIGPLRAFRLAMKTVMQVRIGQCQHRIETTSRGARSPRYAKCGACSGCRRIRTRVTPGSASSPPRRTIASDTL